jgi:hypothetical protein
VSRGAWVATVVVLFLLAAMLLAACGPKVAPPVFAEAPPPIAEPVHEPWVAPTDTFPACLPTSFLPGRPPPLTADGKATCRGIVLPESDFVELHLCAADLPYWKAVAEGERVERLLDQARCEDVASARFVYGEEMRREARAKTWAGYGLGIGGLVVGVAIGLAASAVSP